MNEYLQIAVLLIGAASGLGALVTNWHRHRKTAIRLCGACLVFVSVVVLTGHLLNSAYTMTESDPGMAALTAACFFIVGMCLIALATGKV